MFSSLTMMYTNEYTWIKDGGSVHSGYQHVKCKLFLFLQRGHVEGDTG
jgi:hypothetical protein